MRTWLFAFLLLLLGIAVLPSWAQVGRQATPEEAHPGIQDIPSPMLLEFPLAKPGGKPLSDPSVQGRTYYDTKGYRCDKMTIPKITIIKKAHGGSVDLEVTPVLKTEWTRQDINLRIALIGADGKEIQPWTVEALTIGKDDSVANKLSGFVPFGTSGGSQSKMPTAKFSFREDTFRQLFEGEGPKLRLVVTIPN